MIFRGKFVSIVAHFLVVLACFFSSFEMLDAFRNDAATYYLMGGRVFQGDLPYRDFFSHKGPAYLYFNSISFGIFGLSVWGPFLVITFSKMIFYVAVVAASRFFSVGWLWESFLLSCCGLLFFALNSNAGIGFFLAGFVIGALICILKKKYLIGASFCLIAFFTRADASILVLIFTTLFGYSVYCWHGKKLCDLGLERVGILVASSSLFIALVLSDTGWFDLFVYHNYKFNSDYAASFLSSATFLRPVQLSILLQCGFIFFLILSGAQLREFIKIRDIDFQDKLVIFVLLFASFFMFISVRSDKDYHLLSYVPFVIVLSVYIIARVTRKRTYEIALCTLVLLVVLASSTLRSMIDSRIYIKDIDLISRNLISEKYVLTELLESKLYFIGGSPWVHFVTGVLPELNINNRWFFKDMVDPDLSPSFARDMAFIATAKDVVIILGDDFGNVEFEFCDTLKCLRL